jgi:hypothetical protein
MSACTGQLFYDCQLGLLPRLKGCEFVAASGGQRARPSRNRSDALSQGFLNSMRCAIVSSGNSGDSII